MHLYCLNEVENFQVFQYRKDRDGLKDLVQRDERYRHIDIDTLETNVSDVESAVCLERTEKLYGKERRERGGIRYVSGNKRMGGRREKHWT